jgi:hypothetical protein
MLFNTILFAILAAVAAALPTKRLTTELAAESFDAFTPFSQFARAGAWER